MVGSQCWAELERYSPSGEFGVNHFSIKMNCPTKIDEKCFRITVNTDCDPIWVVHFQNQGIKKICYGNKVKWKCPFLEKKPCEIPSPKTAHFWQINSLTVKPALDWSSICATKCIRPTVSNICGLPGEYHYQQAGQL